MQSLIQASAAALAVTIVTQVLYMHSYYGMSSQLMGTMYLTNPQFIFHMSSCQVATMGMVGIL